MAAKLGILAGSGDLPFRVMDACRAQGRPFFVLALEGAADPARFEGVPHGSIRPGAIGEGLRILRENAVEELVMAGPVRRPTLTQLRPDWHGAKMAARIGLRALGDDALLSTVIRELEHEGFRVIGLHELLDDLLMPSGALTIQQPDAQAEADIAHGVEVAQTLGALDVGQAVIVQQGIVLGVEAVEGTDALIARAGDVRREGLGGVLVKIAKPGQERRVDLPAIGVGTVEACARAGLRGIALQASASLVLQRQRVVAAADRTGLFVIGIELT